MDNVLHAVDLDRRLHGGDLAAGDSRPVVEMALAHAVGDKVEAAYRRGDLFEKRRHLMGEWASYCNTPVGSGRDKVVPMRSGR
jgi:hypothetical protein